MNWLNRWILTLAAIVLIGCAWSLCAQPLQLAQDGTPCYDILLPETANAKEKLAAEELRHYLNLITGGDFAIVPTRGTRPVLAIGAPQGCAVPELGTAGVAILPQENGDIVLAGGSRRGALGGAYQLLDLLGVRWWEPDIESVPRQADLVLPKESKVEIPVFPDLRDPQTALTNDSEWTLRNQGNGIYSGVPEELGGFVRFASWEGRWWMGHTYESILPATQENFERYPEAFMLLPDQTRSKSQLCPSSPIVRAFAVQAVIAAMKGDPTGEITLAQSDVPIRCHCLACNELIEQEETPAAPHLALVNHVARAVREAGITDRNLIFLGYQQTRKPPRHMVMEPNTTLWLCTDIQSHAKHLPIRENAEFVDNLAHWRRIVPRVYIWDYYVNFNNFLNYEPSLYAMSDNLKFYRDSGVTGVMLQGDLQSRGGAMQGASGWVLERLLWNPEQDAGALLEEYATGYFGVAAEPMKRLYREIYSWGVAGQLAPEDYPRFERFEAECLSEAKRLAAESPEVTARLEVAEVPQLVRRINAESMRCALTSTPYPAELSAAMTHLQEIAARHKITHFSEGGLLAGWLERIRRREHLQLAATTRQLDGVTVWKLNSLWKFRALNLITTPEEIDREIAAGVKVDCADRDWNDYLDNLGVGWEEQGFPGFDGVGIFRNRFQLPEELTAAYYYMLIGSVDEEAWVYLNGSPAFSHTLESTGLTLFNIWNHPFVAEVKAELRPGENQVTIVCRDSAQMGGLYLPVWVIASDRELSRKELWSLSGAVHPYGLDGGDEIVQ